MVSCKLFGNHLKNMRSEEVQDQAGGLRPWYINLSIEWCYVEKITCKWKEDKMLHEKNNSNLRKRPRIVHGVDEV